MCKHAHEKIVLLKKLWKGGGFSKKMPDCTIKTIERKQSTIVPKKNLYRKGM